MQCGSEIVTHGRVKGHILKQYWDKHRRFVWSQKIKAIGVVCFCLTCPTHWIARRRREHLWCKVFKRHDLSVILNNGFQVECSLLVAVILLRKITIRHSPRENIAHPERTNNLLIVTGSQQRYIFFFSVALWIHLSRESELVALPGWISTIVNTSRSKSMAQSAMPQSPK